MNTSSEHVQQQPIYGTPLTNRMMFGIAHRMLRLNYVSFVKQNWKQELKLDGYHYLIDNEESCLGSISNPRN